MISHTASFKKLKDETQLIFDFAVLSAYAVPYLKHGIQQDRAIYTGVDFDSQPMPFRPDTFRGNTQIGKVEDSAGRYRSELAKTIRLSSFSFFEVYIGDIIQEVLEFHAGGSVESDLDVMQDLSKLAPDLVKARSLLREPPRKNFLDKYRARIIRVQSSNIRFPHHGFIRAGLVQMRRVAKSYRSAEIPTVLFDALGLDLTPQEKSKFHDIRLARNRIAHGKAEPKDKHLRPAIDANFWLRELALKIDGHVLDYWMVVDPLTLPYAAK